MRKCALNWFNLNRQATSQVLATRQLIQQIQAAEARVAAQNDAATGYGGVPGGSSSSGVSLKPNANITTHVRLSNGVELELGGAIATIDELTTMVKILGRMPCSGSTTI